MAGGQELAMDQIVSNLGHKRAWDLGEKKENDEGVPFYLLLASGMHCGGRNDSERIGGGLVWVEADLVTMHRLRQERRCSGCRRRRLLGDDMLDCPRRVSASSRRPWIPPARWRPYWLTPYRWLCLISIPFDEPHLRLHACMSTIVYVCV